MESLNIRWATIDDLPIISAVGITTCYEAYFELDPSQDLAEYCLKFFDLKLLNEEFSDPNSTFIVAEVNGRTIGYAKLREGKEIECLHGQKAIETQRIYILEKLKGRGVGQKLLKKCCEIGKTREYEMLWLGVWDKNLAAQEFYKKME